MNQEKETMQTVSSAGEYLAPSIKVKEFSAKRVMCQSGGSNDSWTDEERSLYD